MTPKKAEIRSVGRSARVRLTNLIEVTAYIPGEGINFRSTQL
jgi:ribosomal protein S12